RAPARDGSAEGDGDDEGDDDAEAGAAAGRCRAAGPSSVRPSSRAGACGPGRRPSSGSGPARRTPRPPPSAAPGARSWAWATDAPTGITPAPQGTTVPVPRAIPVPRTTPARRAAAAPFVRTARSHGVTTVTSRADVCAGTVGRVGPDGPQKIR